MARPELKRTNSAALKTGQTVSFDEQDATDFGSYLRTELDRRRERNARYSLRAFASALGVESSYLSKLMRSERPSTPATILRLGARLNLSPTLLKKFTENTEITLLSARRQTAIDYGTLYTPLSPDQFQVISDWYHYALIELTEVEGFDSRPTSIARSLNISVDQAKGAILRLTQLGLLKTDSHGNLVATGASNTTLSKHPSTNEAFRCLQRQTLEMAQKALEEVAFEERSQSSITLSIDASQMEEARELLNHFRRKFARLMKASRKKTRVYHLSFSLYPVSAPFVASTPISKKKSAP